MQEAIDEFRANMVRVRNLGYLFDDLNARTYETPDLSDLLRAELVLAVSALDQFVHEVARLGMLEAYRGERERTPQFLRFQVSAEGVLRGMGEGAGDEWFDIEIRNRNVHRSFQNPDRIAEALRLVSSVSVWNEVGGLMDMDAGLVRDRLKSIVDRRNQIAHEADVNPTLHEGLWQIDSQTTADDIDFIERVGEHIYDAIA